MRWFEEILDGKYVKKLFALIMMQKAFNMNQHRKFQLTIFKTEGVVYGITDTHKKNRELLYRFQRALNARLSFFCKLNVFQLLTVKQSKFVYSMNK